MKALNLPEGPARLLTRDFDDTQYGHKQIPESEFKYYLKHFRELYAEIERRKKAA